jgi:uncharacterized protein (DUF1697 family)
MTLQTESRPPPRDDARPLRAPRRIQRPNRIDEGSSPSRNVPNQFAIKATTRPVYIPQEVAGGPRRHPRIPASWRTESSAFAPIPAYRRSARRCHDRPVTSEVAGSSLVAPGLVFLAAKAVNQRRHPTEAAAEDLPHERQNIGPGLVPTKYGAHVRYIALLRGINVGGKTQIKMADLKTSVEELGLENVSTYIASGNVLFESRARDAAKLEESIERAIEQRFRLPVKVVVLDRAAFTRIVKAIPRPWLGDNSLRANVAFVRRGTDAKQVIRELEPDAAVEEVKAINGAILWATKRNAVNRSVMRKLIGGAVYKELTVRNLSTTLKLQELLAQ